MTGVGLHMQVHVEFFSKFYRAEGFKNNFQSKLANFLLLKADAIRPVSGKIAKYCVEHLRISPEKIDVIPLLIDAEKIRNSPIRTDLHKTYPQFKKIILMACRLTKQKNIPLAMEVLNDLPQDVGLVLVGKGEEEPAIRAIIARLRLERRVIILPWSDDVASLMKTADVFLISSDYEGYVMTSMESSVAGLPIVMTDVGGAGEFVENGVNGIVTAVGDRAELVAGVQKILNDPTVRQKLIAGASQKSAALPTYDSYIMAMIASWKKAAKSKMSGFQK
jgi:glycosyltransferase involved in cell wall biosynthesis